MLVQSDFSNTMDTNIVHPGILLPIVYMRECVCVCVCTYRSTEWDRTFFFFFPIIIP